MRTVQAVVLLCESGSAGFSTLGRIRIRSEHQGLHNPSKIELLLAKVVRKAAKNKIKFFSGPATKRGPGFKK